MKYRKKPIVVEAYQITPGVYEDLLAGDIPLDSLGCPDWIQAAWEKKTQELGAVYVDDLGFLQVRTLEGAITVSKGDWIIQGISWELYPCKPDIFEKIYEEVKK